MAYFGLHKVISGGQTGADQGGLIAAHRLGVLTGGTAPANWATAIGPNPLLESFGLKARGSLNSRTERNIQDSDGTVILTKQADSAGSVLTRSLCVKHKKPYLDLDLEPLIKELQSGGKNSVPGNPADDISETLFKWLMQHQVRTLNVAGNRERHTNLLITSFTDIIVTNALRLLDLEGMLIRDSDL